MQYPYGSPATALEPGQVIDIKGTRHVVENVERSESGVNVRIEFTSGLRAVTPSDKLFMVVGLHNAPPREAPPQEAPKPAPPPPTPKPVAPEYRPASVERRVQVGCVVQITDPGHKWYPCLLIVSELRSWGVQGYCLIPSNDGNPTGQAFINLTQGKYEWVGEALILSHKSE